MPMYNGEMKKEEMNGKMENNMKPMRGKMNNGDPVMMKDMMKKCDKMIMSKMNDTIDEE